MSELCPICGYDMSEGLGDTPEERYRRHLSLVARDATKLEEHEITLQKINGALPPSEDE